MATGISKGRGRRLAIPAAEMRANGALDVRLCYEGKSDEATILATPPSALRCLWPADPLAESPNHLYFGDNLSVLAALLQNPAIRGQVRLIYIDPPYATGGSFQSRDQRDAYDDLLVGAHYLEFLRARLILMRELLANDGSIYVHLDENMVHQVKLIMDEIFDTRNYRAFIARKKCNPKNYTRRTYGNIADYILFYTKGERWVWNRPTEAWTETRAKEYRHIDKDGRLYMKVPVHAPGVRNGATGQPWRGMPPPPGKHWQYPPAVLDEMDARGEIYWSPTGNPRRKVFLDNSDGVPVQDI